MSNHANPPSDSPERLELISPVERLTHLRYSLVNGVIMEDIIIGEFSQSKKRIVALSSPNEQQNEYRKILTAQGLILGKLIHERKQGITYYTVPISSRPITNDAASSAEGSFTYGDKDLFRDIGKMFADVSVLCEGSVITDPVENSLALVDFVRPGERHLYLVPGIEQWLMPLPVDMDALSYYNDYFLKTPDLSDISSNLIKYFHEGYSEGLAEKG